MLKTANERTPESCVSVTPPKAFSAQAGRDKNFLAFNARWQMLAAFVVTCFAFAQHATATETFAHNSSATLPASQWEVLDIQFQVSEVPKNPTELDFQSTFKNTTGDELTIAGIYNGDREYLLRFTAPASGQWTYSTKSSLPELNNLNGRLDVRPPKAGRKGGIIIDPQSSTRFRYKNGDSYYPIAFEADWLFALDAENEADIPATRTFVDQLAANGFNQVVMNVFAYDVNWAKDKSLVPEHDFGSPNVFPFGGNNDTPDHSQLNIDYFKRLDRVVEYLDEKDIAAHLMIYVWNKRVNWPEANSAADNRYFDYVVKRYQAFPNLIWDVSKEALGYGHSDVTYIHKRIKRLQKADSYNRLLTVHDYGYCRRFTDNVDFVSVQLWTSELHSVMRKVRSDMPGKPILNIEHGGYERGPYVVFNGNYTSPETCLERAYQCVFAGTYPTHYWQGAAWNVFIADVSSLPPESRPKLHYYRHMRTLVDKYKLNDLKSGDKKSNAGFALHNDDDLYVYYVPAECEFFGLRLPKDRRDQMMTQTWFNPFDGSFTESVRQKITQWPAVAKPTGNGFRILIVKVLHTD